jgi:cellulose synthase/poly-beta-1,6-N-acetylglucosamine synthase-like glycosyltransferase
MPTAIRHVDARHLPASLEALDGYDRALVLVRWAERPIVQLELRVHGGRVPGAVLRRAIEEAAAPEVLRACADETLSWTPRDAGTLPATSTIAVCTRDRPDDLVRCLDALARLPDDGQEILVVDSASSTDATRTSVARYARVRYVREDRPGLDVARNRALREARGEIVAFTDDDAAPDTGWLRALRSNFGDPRTLCVTGLTFPLELETPAQECFERVYQFGRGLQRRVLDGLRDSPFNVARAGAGVNMALRRSVLDLAGPFDEALDAGTPTKSGGDHDMFSRILLSGYRIVYDPSALTSHRHRREWSELRDTVHGYGCGVYAHLTSQVLRGELGAVQLALAWLRIQARGLARSLFRRPGSAPLDLVLAELAGCTRGPFALLQSRLASRAGRRAPPGA